EETTPPVMKMYFVGFLSFISSAHGWCFRSHREQALLGGPRIFRRVHASFCLVDYGDADRNTRLERPELLETLQLLQRTRLELDPAPQRIRRVRVQSDVTEQMLRAKLGFRRPATPHLPNRRPGKIKRGARRAPADPHDRRRTGR